MKIKVITVAFFLTTLIQAQTLQQRIDSLAGRMTLAEKILQLHKEGGMTTADNIRLGIPGFSMADGPHGVREGMATSFPVGIGMAATWDTELAERVGKALGEEFRGKGKHQMLGPAMDMTRDPRNGRTPESGGEDPFLNAMINSAATKGVQQTPIIATAKHYNGKHKQANRTNNDYFILQRQLMEHYGLNFRKNVQDAGALSVMSAYNLINGFQAAENPNLLTTILRTNWGFPFYVVSDWGGIKNSKYAINAGNDVCMGSDHYQNDLLNLVNTGQVSTATIDKAVKNVLRTKIVSGMMDYLPSGNPEDVNSSAHQQLCLEAGMKSIVLLKNSGHILPIAKDTITKIAVIGPNANIMQTDGTGSSWVTPFYTITPRQGIENYVGASKVLYAEGCTIAGGYAADYNDALAKAAQAQVVIYFGGLDQSQEGEGLDRANGSIELPGNQKSMISQLAAVNPNLIVVLVSGGITGVNSYLYKVKGLIQAFYPGQEGGNAIARVIFGDYNPSGKLPVTIPKSDAQYGTEITDFDFTNDFGCGYRWFDNKGYVPEFAFGYGLSYSTFSFSNFTSLNSNVDLGKNVNVSVDVTNTSNVGGTETVQLYVSKPGSPVSRDIKALIAFQKVYIEAGQTKTVSFEITPENLYYFDENNPSYKIEAGSYILRAGNSSDNLPVQVGFNIIQQTPKPDLQIANVYTIPRYPVIGDKVQFAATIINRGSGASPAGTSHEVRFSVNGVQISKSISFTNSIPAGGMAFVSGDVPVGSSIFWDAASLGQNVVRAIVNPSNMIDETYQNNNIKDMFFSVYPVPPVNLALRKTIYVSSIEGAGYEGYRAIDGSYGTRWSSAFSDPQNLVINFGSVISFNQIKLSWEVAYGKEYFLQTSNDSINWTTIFYQPNGSGGVEVINANSQGKFLRMLGLRRGTAYGYSLYEIEVFNNTGTDIDLEEPENSEHFEFNLSQNYPNPFNSSTTINFYLPDDSSVRIKILNSLGEAVYDADYGFMQKGPHSVNWAAKDRSNSVLPSGVYFCQIIIPGNTLIKKMMLHK